jgi:hypothetical protein
MARLRHFAVCVGDLERSRLGRYRRPAVIFGRDHSITWSARAISVSGTVTPMTFAARKLTTRSNLIGACTGRSAAFSPLRMRST